MVKISVMLYVDTVQDLEIDFFFFFVQTHTPCPLSEPSSQQTKHTTIVSIEQRCTEIN